MMMAKNSQNMRWITIECIFSKSCVCNDNKYRHASRILNRNSIPNDWYWLALKLGWLCLDVVLNTVPGAEPAECLPCSLLLLLELLLLLWMTNHANLQLRKSYNQ